MVHVAVVDVETTGLNPYRHDRIVEVAVVVLSLESGVELEYTTLVNPDRDIGPTSIHGLTATDVANAPRFNQIAGRIAEMLSGVVAIVGHCVWFDVSFLRSEFRRMDGAMPEFPRFDTRELAGGGTLATCCADYDVAFEGQAHAALSDARAAAGLFQQLVARGLLDLNSFNGLTPVEWPDRPRAWADPLPRAGRDAFGASPSRLLQRALAKRKPSPVSPGEGHGETEYGALLDHVLEDRRIDPSEAEALRSVAVTLGLSQERIDAIHLAYLSSVARAAWTDRHLTGSEVRELHLVSRLLGFGTPSESQFLCLVEAPETAFNPPVNTSSDSFRGMSVCFTGECLCALEGAPISRERAEDLARSHGLDVRSSVTKHLDLLVVGDPSTVSTKAKMARKYGVREIHEPVFWRTIGVRVD